MWSLKTGACLLPLLVSSATATPNLALDIDFPDPAITFDTKSGDWYSFATAGNGNRLQVAQALSNHGPWTLLDIDLLPKLGPWAVTTGIWAPDVRYLAVNNSFVMYYSAPYAADQAFHCVGAAIADNILGPYIAIDDPIGCPISQGGAIDPAGFYDEASGTQWVLYKVDGNSIGHGGVCGNGIEPVVPTPILMQQVGLDGYTKIGDPIEVLDRSDADGPLVEAPQLIKTADGTYVLFFSSNCYSTPQYDVSYATSRSLKGPYKKSSTPLLVTGDYNLTSPGGAQSVNGGGQMVFHANCDEGRCMYQSSFEVKDNIVTLTC
ncbi:glycosyl hydrolase family 43 protein [Lasiosphaeris hirsuta]|uniref:Glycosyl hydrolase family 43 protein n=1 Tax=Lasiosphaeris hirsuta TaxID=260670 RepID=A0AA40A2H5_9PEZI|nr:glycosyl hydrolase family 43 protein [Lasiosphaeris hirsuta]